MHRRHTQAFEVVTQVDGVDCAVLSDQVKSLDWRVNRAKRKAVVGQDGGAITNTVMANGVWLTGATGFVGVLLTQLTS